MNKMVMLEYVFCFDPNATWSHLYQFEQDLGKFFSEHGMEAQIMTPMNGYQGRKIIMIAKQQAAPLPEAPKPPKPGAIQKQINKLRGGK